MRYDGPAPIVESIADEHYAVDRGNGVVPIDFYIERWGVPIFPSSSLASLERRMQSAVDADDFDEAARLQELIDHYNP